MSSSTRPDLDVDIAILGSGFGGTLTALIARQLGFRVAVFDRAAHPRFAVGESSTPLADRLLGDLADLYDLPFLKPLTTYGTWKATYPQLNVGRKRGFSYLHHRPSQAFRGEPGDLLMVAASESDVASDTHWYRADVDAWLADRCREAGIPLFERYEAGLERGDDRPWKIFDIASQGPRSRARLIVDATGPVAVVPRYLGLDRVDVHEFETHSSAVFGHWRNIGAVATFDRLGDVASHPYVVDDAAVHHVLEDGWMWQLRFDDGRVSVGICFDGEDRVTPEWFARAVFAQPTLARQLAAAIGPPEHLQATGRLQRCLRTVAGDDWVALPHTIGFVDPLHSTGIALTLGGVSKLARALSRWDPRGSATERTPDWGMRPVLSEIRRIDRLVAMAYRTRHDRRAFEAAVLLYTACAMASETAADAPSELFVDPERLLDGAISTICQDSRKLASTEIAGEELICRVREAAARIGITAIEEPQVPGIYTKTATKS